MSYCRDGKFSSKFILREKIGVFINKLINRLKTCLVRNMDGYQIYF